MSHPLRWTTLLTLPAVELPTAEEIGEAYERLYSDLEPPIAGAGTARLRTLSLGGMTGAVTLAPQPIPWAQLAAPCAAAWYWPEAAATMRPHVAHALATIIDEGGRGVDKGLALTRLTAAVASLGSVTGVYWGPGRLVHAPEAFVGEARLAGDDNLPLFLWVDFRLESASDGWRLFTTGLEPLGVREIEAVGYLGDPQSLRDHAYNFADYQLTTGKAIRHGERIGFSDEVEATIERGPSLFGGVEEALRLRFDAQRAE